MPDGGEYARPSNDDELTFLLTRLELLLTDAPFDSKSIRTIARQAGLPAGFIELEGEPADQWHEVVRKCNDHHCLKSLFIPLQKRLKGSRCEEELRQIIELIGRKITPFEVRIKGDLDAVSNGLRVVLALENPMDGATELREIRSALTTLVDQLDDEDIVIVAVTRQEGLNIREKMVWACLEVIAAVDQLLGIVRLRDAPRISGELLRDSGDVEVREMRQMKAALDARSLLFLRGRRLRQLAVELLPAGTGRADAAPSVAGSSPAATGPGTV